MSAELSLREVLAGWRPLPIPPVQEPARLLQQVERLKQQLGDVAAEQCSPYELDETLRVLRGYWQEGRLDQVPRRHLRRSPYVLFYGPKPHVGDDPAFLEEYFRVLWQQPNARTLAGLIYVFLRDYPVQSAGFHWLREGIARSLSSFPSMRLQAWRERCDRRGLLGADGPQRFARDWLRDDIPASTFLEEAGLKGELALKGFVMAAYDALLEVLRQALEQSRDPHRVLDRVLDFSLQDGMGLRFPARRAALAEALLMPFTTRECPDSLRDRVKSFLLQYYGHPRIKPMAWEGVREEAQTVILRWIVGTTLDAFFAIVDQTARPDHWQYRREFWRAYFKANHITDAWIVLGAHPRGIADRSLKELRGSYGILRGGQPNQSVLLMRIGGLTIAEWSHDGACRIWPPGDREAPKLYQPEYDHRSLKGTQPGVAHHHSQTGAWQYRIATRIAELTGIQMSPREYLPGQASRRGA